MPEKRSALKRDSLRVLVVDDNPHVLSALVDVLEEEPSVRVVGATLHAEDAIALADAQEPDAVLADMNMPGKGATYVIKTIRETHPETRIVALSALLDPRDTSLMLSAGADSCFSKSANFDSLLRSLTS